MFVPAPFTKEDQCNGRSHGAHVADFPEGRPRVREAHAGRGRAFGGPHPARRAVADFAHAARGRDGPPRRRRKFEQAIRKRAERTIEDLEGRRARIIASLEEQTSRLVETVVRRLNLVTEDEVKELRKRVAHLERRLDQLAAGKEKAA